MSALDKQYVIKLDLSKETYNEDMEFSISDLETSDFWIDIKKSRKAMDFTDCNIVLYITKPNGNIRTLDAVFDINNRMHYCNLTTETKNLLGDYEIQVVVNDFNKNERLVVPSRIKYHVINDILNDSYENVEELEDDFKEKYDTLLFDLEVVKTKNSTQDERLTGLEVHRAMCDETLVSLDGRISDLAFDLELINGVDREQTRAIDDIKLVNSTHESQIQVLDEGLNELTSRFNSDTEDIKNAIIEINNELDGNNLTLEDLTNISIQNTLGINNLEDQYEEKFLEIEQETSEYMSTTNSRLTSVESKNTTQDSRINSIESKHTSLNNVVDTIRVVNSNQTIEINNLKNRVTTLEQKISELEALIEKLQEGKE